MTVDILVNADNLDDYNILKITYDTWSDGSAKTSTPYDVLAAGPGALGMWIDDYPILTYDAFPVDDGIPILFLDFDINNPYAGDVTFYVDDLTFNYTPEPGTLALLGLAGLPLLRRRR